MLPNILRHLRPKKINHNSEKFYLILWFFLIIIFQPCILEAKEWLQSFKTRYSTIYYTTDNDLNSFNKNIGSGFLFFDETPEKNQELIKDRIDKIVEKVESFLDMYPQDLDFSIYLFQNHNELEDIYNTMGALGETPISFYSHTTKAIYVVARDITDRILAHEIAHTVINFYFVVPPPAKMQEILAQYADKHLWEK